MASVHACIIVPIYRIISEIMESDFDKSIQKVRNRYLKTEFIKFILKMATSSSFRINDTNMIEEERMLVSFQQKTINELNLLFV